MMSNKESNQLNSNINFVIGKGNVSAICGGVAPIQKINIEQSKKSNSDQVTDNFTIKKTKV